MSVILEYIGYMGFGALLLALVQYYLMRRDKRLDRKIEEQKEAYAGLLNAVFALRYDKKLDESDVNLWYWVARVQLVCSSTVLKWLFELEGSGRRSFMTKVRIDALIIAIRHDLGIAE